MNENKLFRTWLLVIVSIFNLQKTVAQEFNYIVYLPTTQQKGFHKIVISPNISAKAAADFSDFRLFDPQKKEVPYMLRKDFISKQHKIFVPYRLMSKTTPGDTATEIVVQNELNNKINNLSLFINNAEVSKQVIISGSYNQKEWYAVKQNYNISGIVNQNKVTELNTIYFPLTDYKFFKILINDKNSLPIKVAQAGYYVDSLSYGQELRLPKPQIKITENAKELRTFIQLDFNEPHHIDKLEIKIAAPTLYHRPLRIYTLHNVKGSIQKVYLQETTLFAGSDNQIILEHVYEKQLLLEIVNDNNPPLQIDQIACFQMTQYLIAYLETAGNYVLKFGNKTLPSPVYDLSFFDSIIPKSIPVVETEKLNIVENPDHPVSRAVKPFFYNKKFFLWTSIIAVALLLLFISSKMLNEMNKNKKE